MADLKTFAEQLVNLSVKEVSELADILKNEYGIEPIIIAFLRPVFFTITLRKKAVSPLIRYIPPN